VVKALSSEEYHSNNQSSNITGNIQNYYEDQGYDQCFAYCYSSNAIKNPKHGFIIPDYAFNILAQSLLAADLKPDVYCSDKDVFLSRIGNKAELFAKCVNLKQLPSE